MAALHLMVGLPCSGKTTYARRLARTENALLLTPDVWQLRLFGDDMGTSRHDRNHDAVEVIMWEVAERALELGCSVILDFGFWSRAEREDFRARARGLGVDFRIHYREADRETLYIRLEQRNREGTGDTFRITRAEMEGYIGLFEPPTADELE